MELNPHTILLITPGLQDLKPTFGILHHHYKLYKASTHHDAEETLKKKQIDLVLMEIDHSDFDGFKIIQLIRQIGNRTEMLIFGNTASIKNAVKRVGVRARDCIEKPYAIHDLANKIQRIFDEKEEENDIPAITEGYDKYYNFENIVGNDKKIRHVFELIKMYAKVDGTVLIQGESGTGKELVAKAIHNRSVRWNMPFIVINCAAIPSELMEKELFGHTKGAFTGASTSGIGKMEIADNGTVFLDDIDSLDVFMQAKLLRVIQEKEFERLGSTIVHHLDVRFIAATNKDLKDMVHKGSFREDLYYRLNVLPVNIPALRERKKDICMLLKYYLKFYSTATGLPTKKFSKRAINAMTEYDWPGNVRELKNLVERLFAVNRGCMISLGDIPNSVKRKNRSSEGTLKEMIIRFEEECVKKALVWANGNKKKAARKLGIHRNTLLNKINTFRLNR